MCIGVSPLSYHAVRSPLNLAIHLVQLWKFLLNWFSNDFITPFFLISYFWTSPLLSYFSLSAHLFCYLGDCLHFIFYLYFCTIFMFSFRYLSLKALSVPSIFLNYSIAFWCHGCSIFCLSVEIYDDSSWRRSCFLFPEWPASSQFCFFLSGWSLDALLSCLIILVVSSWWRTEELKCWLEFLRKEVALVNSTAL